MTAKEIIRSAAVRAAIPTQARLASVTGICPASLSRKMREPGLFTGAELGAIIKATRMSDEDRLALLKELERRRK